MSRILSTITGPSSSSEETTAKTWTVEKDQVNFYDTQEAKNYVNNPVITKAQPTEIPYQLTPYNEDSDAFQKKIFRIHSQYKQLTTENAVATPMTEHNKGIEILRPGQSEVIFSVKEHELEKIVEPYLTQDEDNGLIPKWFNREDIKKQEDQLLSKHVRPMAYQEDDVEEVTQNSDNITDSYDTTSKEEEDTILLDENFPFIEKVENDPFDANDENENQDVVLFKQEMLLREMLLGC